VSPWRLLPLVTIVASARSLGAWGVAVAPLDTSSPRPVIVVLHGMWAGPEDICPSFESAATPFGFLVCPRGNTPFGQGRMWTGTYADAAHAIRLALDAAAALAPGRLQAKSNGTLVGYSNGAYFAAEVAQAEPGRWSGLVLLSMKLDLDAVRLGAAGVRRIVLAAGDYDEASGPMEAVARRLDGDAGLQARFMSLGPVGHPFPPDMGSRMCTAIAWVRGESEAQCGGPRASDP
jgi:predicted esterase